MSTRSETQAAAQDASPTGLAERLHDARARAEAAEVDLLVLAGVWADAHPELDNDGQPVPATRVDNDALASHFAGIDPEDELDAPAWAGLPPVAWRAPTGLGTACGLSTRAARALLRDVAVLRHRLPAIWARVTAGEVRAWRARMIAQEVAGAPDDVAAAIDSAVAPVADRAGQVTLRRRVDEVMLQLYPEQVEMASLEALDRRYVRLEHASINHTGVADMTIRGDYADLDDFDATLTSLAGVLDRLDPEAVHESADVRRSRAVGVMADPTLAQQLLAEHDRTGTDEDTPDGSSTPAASASDAGGSEGAVPGEATPADAADTSAGRAASERPAPRRQTRLELRITDLALMGLDPVGACSPDTTDGFVTLVERVAAWCGRPSSDLTVQPVLDPDAHASTDSYGVRAGLRNHIDLRDRHCLFPYCTHPARSCDHDHVVPYDQGGATCTCNLVPLCRHHHRLKTRAGYQATTVEPGVVWWLTPHGHEFVVDHLGTLPTHRAPPTGAGCLHAERAHDDRGHVDESGHPDAPVRHSSSPDGRQPHVASLPGPP